MSGVQTCAIPIYPQLEAYSAALEKILELPVKRRVLYFFSAGRTMEV